MYQKWYMDGGGIVPHKVWELLKAKGPALGLHLNPAKCEWSWLNARNSSDCPLRSEGVALVPTDEVCILRALGSGSQLPLLRSVSSRVCRWPWSG